MSSMIGRQGLRGATGTPKGQKLSGYDVGQLQNFSPEQMQLFQSLFQHTSPDSFTSKLAQGDEDTFQQMEAPAYRDFSGIQGNLASRFSGLGGQGSLGSRRSSGFQNTMNQAGSDFAQNLQSRRQGLQRQAIQDLMGMGSTLLGQRSFENVVTPKKKPFWQELLLGLAVNAGEAGGDIAKAAAMGAMGI
jgi:hypothetical protein